MTFLVCWGIRSEIEEFVWGVECIVSDDDVGRKFYLYTPMILSLHVLSLPMAFIIEKIILYQPNSKIIPKKYLMK